MAYTIAKSAESGKTVISDVFITEYMPDANGTFVKVYLLGLSQCTKNSPMSFSQMAERLSVTENDVIKAWSFWADKRVVEFDGENVRFLELESAAQVSRIETKPVYSADEIFACAAANKQLGDMLRMVEKILSKPLSSTDLTVLYSIYDYYGMPAEVIPMLVTFCVRNGKKSMRQIEKTAVKWVEKGIRSADDAERYLKKAEEYIKAVNRLKNAMGVAGRNFTPGETKCINSWMYDLKAPFELIMHAFDLCIANTGKLSVKYMDRVIANWYAEGVFTLEKAKSAALKKNLGKSNAKPTGFVNFEQTEYDYDAFERRSIGGSDKK